MQHILFDTQDKKAIKTAILIKDMYLNQRPMEANYVDYLVGKGIDRKSIIGVGIDYRGNSKATAAMMNEDIPVILKALDSLGISTIFVCDATYFKRMAKVKKVAEHVGYVMPCEVKGYEHIKLIYGVNYGGVVYNTDAANTLLTTLHTLKNHLLGQTKEPGTGIIHHSEYPDTVPDIATFLNKLHKYPILAADIETFGLKLDEASLGTIGFSWSEHEGGAFCVDYKGLNQEPEHNRKVRTLLRNFFDRYEGKLIFHKGTFDTKVLIRELYMEDWYDYEGMYQGLHSLHKNYEDSSTVAYLALNECGAKSKRYGLKTLAHNFAGNYAQSDIHDIRLISKKDLLQYNLVDCLSTWYVYHKYYPVMIADEQLPVYQNMMIPSARLLTQMEIVGMPIDLDRVAEVSSELEQIAWKHEHAIRMSPLIAEFEKEYRIALADEYNRTHKVKRKSAEDFLSYKINIGSPDQLSDLLFTYCELPILENTPKGNPSTGADILKSLVNHATDPEIVKVLKNIVGLTKVTKILSTFITAFYKNSIVKPDGQAWLHGGFNLGGTVSGRLSSSGPNLTNLPSGSTYGKLIKSCFTCKGKKLFSGADFNALEARIDALLTKDPNKLAVYTDGYDSHSFNAFAYWPEAFPDVAEKLQGIDVQDHKQRAPIINSIKDNYSAERSDSKPVTFALQFAGTWRTLHTNTGMSVEKSKATVANYKALYQISEKYTQDRIDNEAIANGYITVAFGLRVRTPVLGVSIKNNFTNQSEQEARTAGNAMAQSYGMLTNRAFIAVMKTVEESEFRGRILPSCQIHDAMYFVFDQDIRVVKFLNDAITKEMQWQEDTLIQHPEVGLNGELDIFPTWATGITIPNGASEDEIKELCRRE